MLYGSDLNGKQVEGGRAILMPETVPGTGRNKGGGIVGGAQGSVASKDPASETECSEVRGVTGSPWSLEDWVLCDTAAHSEVLTSH